MPTTNDDRAGKNIGETDRGEADTQRWVRRLPPLIALIALGVLVVSQGGHNYLTLEQLAANRDELKTFIGANLPLALLIFIATYIVVVALSLPGGGLMTISSGFLFGWIPGALVSLVGATIGATIIFFIAKTSLGELLGARAGPWLAKLRGGFQENALSYLLFLRLVPVFPFWLVNLAPALLGVPLSTYLIGTAVGIVPGSFVFAFAGVGLDSIIEAQRRAYETCLGQAGTQGTATCQFTFDPSELLTTELLIASILLGLAALSPVIVKKVRKIAASN